MSNYSVNGIQGIWLENKDNQFVSSYTPEHFVIDEDGNRLDAKLKHLDINAITSAQTAALNAISGSMESAIASINTEKSANSDCIADIYEQIFPLKHNFRVIANRNVSGCTATYHVTGRNGVDVTPDSVVITRTINDETAVTTLLEYDKYTAQAYDATPSDALSGAIQEYNIVITKSGRTDVNVVSSGVTVLTAKARKYVCMYGALSTDTLDLAHISDEDMAKLTKVLADGLNSKPTITTSEGDYIWIIVPSELHINSVTCGGFDVSMEEPTEQRIIGAELYNGFYHAYRSHQPLAANTWNLVLDGNIVVSAIENGGEDENGEEAE